MKHFLGKEEVGSSNLLESLGFSPLKLPEFIGVAVKIAVDFRGLKFPSNLRRGWRIFLFGEIYKSSVRGLGGLLVHIIVHSSIEV